MTTNVEMRVNVTTSGMKEATAASLQLKKNFEGAQAAARIPMAVLAAKTGVAASAKKYNAAAPTGAIASDTNLNRGVSGQTGAAGRDFAAQAQGLGGLVHVYATFAANLFAVSAAFTALSKAMDTTNLVKGLDQIGATSGKNLGSLAKQMVAVADGAISLRQALSSTAMASSGGMSSQAILRMTEVAKKASLALGRDMTDSMDRLTKGIVKTQPELLDELGIMTRMIPAQQEYAREIGKTMSSLTTFEKRQAFANAVLLEGEQKFNDINLSANSYSKVLASISNLLQTTLEGVNKVLGPIVSFLASNPTGLAIAMTAVASILLRQAIPALGMFKENAILAAEQAKKLALVKVSEAQKGYKSAAVLETTAAVQLAKNQFQIVKDNAEAMADEKVAAVVRSENEIKKLIKSARGGAVTKEILGKDIHTEADALAMDKLALDNQQKLNKAIEDGDLKRTAMLDKTVQAQKKYASSIRDNIKFTEEEVKVRAEGAVVLAAEETKIKESENARARAMLEKRSWMNTDRQAQIVADRAMVASISKNITAQAAQTAAARGFSAAMKEAWRSVKEAQTSTFKDIDLGKRAADGAIIMESVYTPALSKVRSGWVMLKAGISGATGALGTFMSFAGIWIQAIGLFVALGGAFLSWMMNANKESEALSTAIDALNASFDNVDKTLEVISKKDIDKVLSVESIQAKANALNDLVDSLSNVLIKFDKLKVAQNGWDKAWNWIKDIFGQGDTDKLAAGLSHTVVDTLKLIEEGPLKERAKKTLSSIFGEKIDLANFKKLNASFKDLDENSIRSKANAVDTLFKDITKEVGNAAAALTEFKTALEEIGKQSTTMTNALIPSDAFSKLGIDMLTAITTFNTALKDPIHALTALRTLAGDMRTISLINPDTALDLIKSKKGMDELSSSLAALERQKLDADAKAKAAEEKAVGTKSMLTLSTNGYPDSLKAMKAYQTGFSSRLPEAEKQAKVWREAASNIDNAISNKKAEIDIMIGGFKNVGQQLAKTSFDNMAKGLAKAQSEAAIISAKSYLDTIKSGGLGTMEVEADLALKAINVQLDVIKSQYSMAEVLQRNVIATDRLADAETLNYLEMNRNEAARRGISVDDIDKKILNLTKGIFSADKATSMIGNKNSSLDIIKLVNSTNKLSMKDPIQVKLYEKNMEIIKKLGPLVPQAFGRVGLEAPLHAQAGVESRKKETGILVDPITDQQVLLGLEEKRLGIQATEINNKELLSSYYSKDIQSQKESNLLEQSINKYSMDSGKIAIDIIKTETDLRTASGKEKEKLEVNLANLQTKSAQAYYDFTTRNDGITIKGLKDRMAGEESIRKFYADIALQQFTSMQDLNSARLSQQDSETKYLETIGAITAEEVTKRQASIALSQQEISYQKEKATLEDKYNTDRIKADDDLKLAKNRGQDTVFEDAKLAAVIAGYDRQKEKIGIINQTKKESITLDAAHKALIDQQTEQMTKMVSITESLATAFGDVGTAIGKAGEAILKMAQDDTNYGIKKIALEKELAAERLANPGEHSDKEMTTLKALEDLKKKNTSNELKSIGNVAGATKKMFAEKTVAYKVMSGIEKAANVTRIAMATEEFLVKIGLLNTETIATAIAAAKQVAIQEGASAATVAASIPAIMAKFFSQLGWFGWVAAGAAILAIGGAMSGSAPTMPGGLTAEEQQKVQGTGQSYISGKLKDTGFGVLGDNTAVSKSLVSSIELVEAHTFETMEYSNKMLDALKSIEKNTESFAAAVSRIPGFTTQGPTSSSGSWLFGKTTSEMLDKGIKLFGTIGDLASGKGNIQQYTNTKSSSSGLFGGLFGGGSTKYSFSLSSIPEPYRSSVQNALGGMFTGVLNTLVAASKTFVTSGSKAATEATKMILESVTIDPEIFKTSTMGLHGQELTDAIQGLVSMAMDKAATEAFPEFLGFQKVGEAFAQTVVRLSNDIRTVGLAFDTMGKKMVTVTDTAPKLDQALVDSLQERVDSLKALGTSSSKRKWEQTGFGEDTDFSWVESTFIDSAKVKALADAEEALRIARAGSVSSTVTAAERLVEMAGGLDTFIDKATFFTDNFLNDAERLAAIQAKVDPEMLRLTDQIDALGYSVYAGSDGIVNSTDEFKNLVLGINTTTEAGAQLYTDLMNVERGFFAVHESVVKVITAEELRAAKVQQEIKIYELLGKSEAALALTRAEEMLTLDDRLKPAQEYIYALEDEATLKDKLEKAYTSLSTSIKTTITNLKTSIQTLKDYSTALKQGNNSNLTPLQKYLDAKQTAYDTSVIANSTGTSAEEVSARNAAISKLPSVASTFLDASKVLYASGGQYTADYNMVSKYIEELTGKLEGQQTDAEKQLAALDESTGYLFTIQASATNIEQYLRDYLDAQTSTETARLGAVTAGSTAALSGAKATISNGIVTGTDGYTGSIADAKQLIIDNIGTSRESSLNVLHALQRQGIDSLLASQILGIPVAQARQWAANLGVPGFSRGGVAQGLSLVGEKGPELVNFANPSRVYSNQASNDMFNNKELVAEIRILRAEVCQLRKDQHEQTGHLIASNFEATAKAADAIAEATEQAATTSIWAERSKLKIA